MKARYCGVLAALLVLVFVSAAAATTPEQAAAQIPITPAYYVGGDTVREIFNDNGLVMNYPSYSLDLRMPIYSYDPYDSAGIMSGFYAVEPIMIHILGGPLTTTGTGITGSWPTVEPMTSIW
jgi:hypothetical protein